MDTRENPICGIVVSYNPSREILQNIAILSGQVGHVVVVDNTPMLKSANVLNEFDHLERCTVIRNGKNLGIGTALNIGIRLAVSNGFSWILTLDQDSQLCDGYVDAMLSTYHEAIQYSRVGMLCPRYVDPGLQVELPKIRDKSGEIVGCMTSGTMIQSETFAALGPMEEDLFIDYVDYEYCMRMRSSGYRLIDCPEAILTHAMGRTTLHRILGRELQVTNHSPKRRYYIHRNRLVLIKRYFRTHRDWALSELKGLMMDSMMVLLIEDKKIAKAIYMARGLFDGVFNRLGQRVCL